jgi:transcriptional regulator with XRE-family HTH domain
MKAREGEEFAARRLFARALTEAVRRAGLSQVEVSERTGGTVSQSTLSEWMSATKPPGTPQAVFAVERALALPPGALSGYLGYLPNELFPVSVETAIAVDSGMDQRLRDTLLDALSRFRPAEGEGDQGLTE